MIPEKVPLTLHYPVTTRVNAHLEFRPRKLIVYRMRDLVTNPLTAGEFLRRPLLYRGRWLAMAKDLESDRIRQVYPTTTKEHFRIVPLRLALYDPDEPSSLPVTIVSRAFDATTADRLALARAIHRLQKLDCGGLELRVLVDDLKLVGA